jgi:hypothetical protein
MCVLRSPCFRYPLIALGIHRQVAPMFLEASRVQAWAVVVAGLMLQFHAPGFVQTSSFGFRGLVVEWGSRRRVSDHIQD